MFPVETDFLFCFCSLGQKLYSIIFIYKKVIHIDANQILEDKFVVLILNIFNYMSHTYSLKNIPLAECNHFYLFFTIRKHACQEV